VNIPRQLRMEKIMELDSVMGVKEVRCESYRCQLLFNNCSSTVLTNGCDSASNAAVLNITQLVSLLSISQYGCIWCYSTMEPSHTYARQAAGTSQRCLPTEVVTTGGQR